MEERKDEMPIDINPQAIEKNTITKKIRENPWMLATFVFGVLTVVLLVSTFAGGVITGNVVSGNKAATNLVSFASASGRELVVNSIETVNGLYKLNIDLDGNPTSLYVTMDGKNLVNGGLLPLVSEASSNQNQQTQTEDIPKTDKPKVELFVMSFCPFGVKAENNVFSILDLFKDKIDFKIKFIVNVGGDDIASVSSLHGLKEAKEDARQVIIMKYYPDKYYSYLKEFDKTCYPLASDETKLDACWKSTATKLGMDISKIETAAYGKEGIDLLKADEAITNQYGVGSSPTLVINGVQSDAIYSGTSATQSAICSAFNTAPTECSTKLADSTTTASGSC